MNKKLTKFKKLVLVFEKHDLLSCYSLSYGRESYTNEVKFLMRKMRKDYDLSKVKDIVYNMFNNMFSEVLELAGHENIEDIEFDVEELSQDIFDIYQGKKVDFNSTVHDNAKCEEICYEILGLLDDLERPLDDFEKELNLGDGVTFDCLSLPELFYLMIKLQDEVDELEKKDQNDEFWKVD